MSFLFPFPSPSPSFFPGEYTEMSGHELRTSGERRNGKKVSFFWEEAEEKRKARKDIKARKRQEAKAWQGDPTRRRTGQERENMEQ